MPSPPESLPLTEDLAGVAFLTIGQVAAAWSCSRRTIERLLNRGELRCVLLGSDRRIPLTELQRWTARHLLLDNAPAPAPLPTAPTAIGGAPRRMRRSPQR